MREVIILMILILVMGGVEESKNSDGSEKTTYSSCSITSSEAILMSDRTNDNNQCWDGVNYKEYSLADDWCKGKVYNYMNSRYSIGHKIEYRISSTNCISSSSYTNNSVAQTDNIPVEQTEGSKNPDTSNKTTYSSCNITSSEAILLSDKTSDINQCWDGVNYKEYSLAEDWCKGKIYNYMNSRYLIGHSVEYRISSTNCISPSPNTNTSVAQTNTQLEEEHETTSQPVKYSIKVTLERTKSNGDNWDIFGGSPDIKMYIDNKYQGLCSDSYECEVEYTSSSSTLYFKIYDKDVSNDDFVGEGSCPINETCQLGQALVEINTI